MPRICIRVPDSCSIYRAYKIPSNSAKEVAYAYLMYQVTGEKDHKEDKECPALQDAHDEGPGGNIEQQDTHHVRDHTEAKRLSFVIF